MADNVQGIVFGTKIEDSIDFLLDFLDLFSQFGNAHGVDVDCAIGRLQRHGEGQQAQAGNGDSKTFHRTTLIGVVN